MGLLKSEIIGLKYSDIDYSKQTIHVQQQLGRNFNADHSEIAPKMKTKQEIKLKTKFSDRVLTIPDIAFQAILEERKRYEAHRSHRKKDFQEVNCKTKFR